MIQSDGEPEIKSERLNENFILKSQMWEKKQSGDSEQQILCWKITLSELMRFCDGSFILKGPTSHIFPELTRLLPGNGDVTEGRANSESGALRQRAMWLAADSPATTTWRMTFAYPSNSLACCFCTCACPLMGCTTTPGMMWPFQPSLNYNDIIRMRCDVFICTVFVVFYDCFEPNILMYGLQSVYTGIM